jgi:hypothetical protein
MLNQSVNSPVSVPLTEKGTGHHSFEQSSDAATYARGVKSLAVWAVFLCAGCVQSQAALKTINGPQGGKITYGQVEEAKNEPAAIVAILRLMQSQYGSRPRLSQFFEAKGTQSVAAFFGINRSNGVPVEGVLIVTKATTDDVEAAAVYDDASHFNISYNPMMKTLMSVWHPLAAASNQGSGGAAAPLHKSFTKDRTASIDLPDGWNISPNSGGGSILAQGPNGEVAEVGFTVGATDLNNPRGRQTYETVRRGGLRGTAYANAIYYQLTQDLGKDFVDLMALNLEKRNQHPGSYQIAGARAVQSPAGYHCARIDGQFDANDGKAPREMHAIFCIGPEGPASGAFLAITDYTLVPMALAEKERATMAAVLASIQVDQAAVQRQAGALAAPAIAQIHEIGRIVDQRIAAAHQAQEIHNSAVYQHWDDIDRRSKAFSDYTLGYTVLRTQDNQYHGTFWNEDANRLLQQFPGAFEAVTTPELIKGLDY